MKKSSLENELKYELNGVQYRRLLKSLKSSCTFKLKTQRNYYFDTPNFQLRKQFIGLRIRYENKSRFPILALKFPTKGLKPGQQLKAFRSRNEFEAKLSSRLARQLLTLNLNFNSVSHKPAKVLKKMVSAETIESLTVLGSMINSRYQFKWLDGLILELDCFKILKQTFYELELETDNPLEADLLVRMLFKNLKIRYKASEKSKLRRFIEITSLKLSKGK